MKNKPTRRRFLTWLARAGVLSTVIWAIPARWIIARREFERSHPPLIGVKPFDQSVLHEPHDLAG